VRSQSRPPEETLQIEIIKSGAPRPLANYNECFKVDHWVFAGQAAGSSLDHVVRAQVFMTDLDNLNACVARIFQAF